MDVLVDSEAFTEEFPKLTPWVAFVNPTVEYIAEFLKHMQE